MRYISDSEPQRGTEISINDNKEDGKYVCWTPLHLQVAVSRT